METAPILTSRPEGMSFEEYKAIRKSQQKEIKSYLKGDYEFVSNNYHRRDKSGKLLKGRTAEKTGLIKK